MAPQKFDADVKLSCSVCSMEDGSRYGDTRPTRVVFECHEDDMRSFQRLADFINSQAFDVVCVQYDVRQASHIAERMLAFYRDVRVPVVTTLHDIFLTPSSTQRRLVRCALALSTAVVALCPSGSRLLEEVYLCDAFKLRVITPGVYDTPTTSLSTCATALHEVMLRGFQRDGNTAAANAFAAALHSGTEPPKIVLFHGLLAPQKGIEVALEAFRQLQPVQQESGAAQLPYLLLHGATNPSLVRDYGESYRNTLKWKARQLGISERVCFVNEYLQEAEDRCALLRAADVCVVCPNVAEKTSCGTLIAAVGAGGVVVASSFMAAADFYAEHPSSLALVPLGDAAALSATLQHILSSTTTAQRMRDAATAAGREMRWDRVAHDVRHVLLHAVRNPLSKRDALNALVELKVGALPNLFGSTESDMIERTLPAVNLEHLRRLTDSTGMIQFATFIVPELSSGYCTDDNARALTVALKYRAQFGGEGTQSYEGTAAELEQLCATYVAFLLYAFDHSCGRFRNFLSFEGQWADPKGIGSEESHGRGMQAIGHACGYGLSSAGMLRIFIAGIPVLRTFSSPRSLAHAMDGAVHVLHAYPQQPEVVDFLRYGAAFLMKLFHETTADNAAAAAHGDDHWLWFEEYLTYSNASLSMALVETGAVLQDHSMLACGLETLRWLFGVQLYHMSDERVVFSPIGCFAAQLRGTAMQHPQHDQQPIEASTFVLAALSAHRATRDVFWLRAARLALDWFLGTNCLGEALYDSNTGGTRDGLHSTGTNCNEGAESLLAWLLALTDWREREDELFQQRCSVVPCVAGHSGEAKQHTTTLFV